jgi:hypothetical protein
MTMASFNLEYCQILEWKAPLNMFMIMLKK